jgi:hypothetical protein
MKKLLLAVTLAGALAVAFGSMNQANTKQKKEVKQKTEKKCLYRSPCAK